MTGPLPINWSFVHVTNRPPVRVVVDSSGAGWLLKGWWWTTQYWYVVVGGARVRVSCWGAR